ncbi:hypothetical protein KR018_010870 [Drosophila ironensis]|nr:hypothetical protein KR018_010870 [Drosophila ironensis]
MATSTLPSPSPSPSSGPSAVSAKNPQLKRVVYSKYRELLGSYNDKANAIIDTLPAYMVRQDRGFQLPELQAAAKDCQEPSYGQRGGGAGNGGYEAPACVQNAMMTKDKKPFTYTPGGIDLSQIRSERMAKRLARNAQSEGATGAAQQNRPAQPQSPGSGGGTATSSMGAAAMGMPFQVLPPPPPPAPLPQTGPRAAAASVDNSYIPYSPAPQQQLPQQQPPVASPKTPPMPQQLPTPPATPPQQQQQEQQQQQFRSVAMPTSPAVNVYTRQTDSPRSPFEQAQRSTESPLRYAQQPQQQSPQQRPPAAISPLAQQQLPQQQQQAQSQVNSSVPWRTQRPQQQTQQLQSHPQPIYNNVQPQQQQQQQQRSRDVFSPARIEAPATGANSFQAQQQQQQNFGTQQNQFAGAAKPTNVGSLYIAPLAQPTEPQAQRILLQQQQQTARDSPMRQLPQQQQQQQPQGNQPLRWLSSQPASKEQAPWARPEENGNVLPSTLRQTTPQPASIQTQTQNQTQAPFYQPPLQTQGNGYGPTPVAAAPISLQNFGSNPQQGGLRLQINLNTNGSNSSSNNANPSAPRERIIPITLEQTPTYAAAQPNFGGKSPKLIPSSQRVMSPNQPPMSATINGTGTRIIPIAIEGGRGGPVSQTPVVLQNDPRSPPIQSKSFRILQKITDTVDDGSDDSQQQQQPLQQQAHQEAELQRPQFARQMSAQQARNSPTIEQMRRLQIAQDQSGTPLAWSPQGNGVSAQNRFTQQRYDAPQQQQQYVPPSEQQVPEPKKYTGSAIPSRSFKILQAMTTPENADHKNHTELDSDLENVEQNENPINHNNNNNNNYNENNNNHNKINSKTNKRHSYTSATPTPPTSTTSTTFSTDPSTHSSNSSLNSDSSCPSQTPRCQSVPPHYPYAYGYPYPWYMPPPPPPNGEGAAPWPYPYPYPPPPAPPQSVEGKPAEGYPPYPYYYPYYPPPPMPPYGPQTGEPQSPAAYPPFYGHPYPYPVAPSYSQSSAEESRASSVLPDIIITPSTDDMPSQVIMQHHIRVEPREPPKRAHSVEIEELVSRPKARNICTSNQEVIDVLSQRLANINKIASGNTQANLSKQLHKNYAGEQSKELGERSPSENASNSDSDSSEESSDDDEEDTPKMGARPTPLQAIKSVTNVQVYKGKTLGQHLDSDGSDSDDDDETTADEMFDEEEQVEEEQEGLVEEMDDYIVEEDLSVIYEEESELERSSEYAKTVIRKDDSRSTIVDEIDKQIEENDDDDEESTSVTVRLPLRFSFSKSSNDENVATVQVGSTTQVEDKRPSIATSSFSVAKVESEDENEDDCEVSVTISLSNSSRSNSVERPAQSYKTSTAYPVEEMTTPCKASAEDVSSSFSLGMRNKFLGDTTTNGVTNNISFAEAKPKIEEVKEVASSPKEEFDFFATLMATKMQAQKMMEQSKNFWKTPEPKPAEQVMEPVKLRAKENVSEAKPPRPKSADMSKTQASLEAAKNSFWSTFETASKEAESPKKPEEKSEEIDFWASIEKKDNKQCPKKKKTVTYTPLQKESVMLVENWTTTLTARVEPLPGSQNAEVHFIVEEKATEPEKVQEEEAEEEEDFWASVEQAKAAKSSEKISNSSNWEYPSYTSTMEKEPVNDFWTNEAKDESPAQTEEVDFWAEISSTASTHEDEKPNNFAYDPTKYPEEPREVDTDEEIDFWAEIEAKRKPGQDDDDDVTFHKSATFWARKERQNSVEETPYKPVEKKAFRAKLPDEPAVEIDVWATLEAAKGEEPVIVDPVVEEEKALAEQYEELEHDTPQEKEEQVATKKETEEHTDMPHSNLNQVDTMSLASMHEPATVYTWAPPPQDCEQVAPEEEVDFWADIEQERAKKEQVEEAEQKRQNYRQAMAFFNTSIDGQQSPPQQQSNRHSVILEAEEPQEVELGPPCGYELVGEDGAVVEEHKPQGREAESESESDEEEEEERGAATPTPNTEPQLPEVYVEPEPEVKLLANGLPDLGVEKFNSEAPKISVRDRISAFEVVPSHGSKALTTQSLSVDSGHGKGTLSRNSSTQRSESEIEEDDSGVTDMNRQLSGTDTESESFPELRKMSSYQRAATHSRLFKLLQDENDLPEDAAASAAPADEFQLKPSRRKIVHNVSITRKQNPSALNDAETMTQRRERLSLPLRKNTSIDADNPSTPNSPASPILGPSAKNQRVVSDKLVNELVQSLLLKSDSTHLRNLPMERLQAAAKRALVEEMDSAQENSSLDSTPAPTPKHDKEYSDYYNSWCEASGSGDEVLPSKAFRTLQDPRRSPWTVRCPRVLSSKTINRDLARVTESPEIGATRGSKSPECFRQNSQSRERSVSSWRRV